MKTLAIDTCTYTLSIGVADGDRLLGEHATNIQKNHSVRLMPAIEALLHEIEMRPNELEKIVVANGPGSYTGVRIGVTVAKTLAWTLNIPVAAVSSLAAIAASAPASGALVCPMIDARRGQVFTGLYRVENGKAEEVAADRHISAAEWCSELSAYEEPIWFVGQDAALHEAVIQDQLSDRAVLAGHLVPYARPAALIELGKDALPQEAALVVPNYARLAEAEAKWLESNGK